MGRNMPVLFTKKEECCGCTACYAICPQSAIMMIEDEEGFEYPKVDETKCLGCYICLEVCPMKVSTLKSMREVYGLKESDCM